MFPGMEAITLPTAEIIERSLSLILYLAPLLLIPLGWRLWIEHRNADWISNIKWILIEVKIPRDIYKSPQAMEMALGNALLQGGGVGERYKRYWEGRVLFWFSLEIISTEGDIHFYIRAPKQFRNVIESQIYAQYPEAEIGEVADYTLPVLASMREEEWAMWGTEFKCTKEEAYPIRTYADFGLDKPISKAEDAAGLIDPITPQIEWMGTMKKDEHVWFQIIVRASKDSFSTGGLFPKKVDWKTRAKNVIKEIQEKYDSTDSIELLGKRLKMSKTEQEAIAAIERSLGKPAFDIGMRAIYLAKKPAFRGENITGLTMMLRQYGSGHLNSFAPTRSTDFPNPWDDPSGKKKLELKRNMLHAYIDRGWFYPPHKRPHFVLTSEELATVFHFPGRVSTTPTFKRIESKKSEPPVNLPV